MGGAGEGYGPLSMAVAPVSLKTRQATCGISAYFYSTIHTIPSQVSTALVITCIHALTDTGSYTNTSHNKIKRGLHSVGSIFTHNGAEVHLLFF